MDRGHGRRGKRHYYYFAGAGIGIVLTACGGDQSALAPASHQDEWLARLGWTMFAGAGAVLLLVAAVLFAGIARE